MTGEKLGGGAIHTRRVFDAKTGRIESITSEDVLKREIQALGYEWDLVGNLTARGETSVGKMLTEAFTYDTLNRLTSAQVTGRTAQAVTYDALGNITCKSDVDDTDCTTAGARNYTYGTGTAAPGPHALVRAGDLSYTYDANGNVLMEAGADRRTTRRLGYTPFNKVSTITRGTHTTNFLYGADRSRIRRTDRVRTGSGTSTTTTLYLSNVEKVIAPDGSFTYKRYITDGVLIEQEYDNTGAREEEDTRYLLYDHLGSVDVITDGVGTVVQDMSFDAWGQRRAAPDWTVLALLRLTDTAHGRTTTRGFTGHEMLDAVGIIHMNGRIYDPKLGRFMQADPVIQFPDYSQSRNRYSYVLNNPLAYTDPTGYFPFFTAFAVVGLIAADITSKIIIAAVIGTAVFADSLAQGAPLGKAFLAGVSAAALTYVAASTFPKGAFGWNAATYKHVVTVATVGGITTSLQGGKFGHGFLSAGIGAAVGGIPALRGVSPGRIAARTVVSAVSAGTVSEITGGKFANGAMTAAFMSLVSSAALKHQAAKPPGRALTKDEIAEAQKVFDSKIEYSMVRVIDGKFVPWQGGGYIIAPNGKIYWPGECGNLATCGGGIYAEDFIHEMTHVLQFQHGVNVLGRGLLLQSGKFLSFRRYDPYKFTYDPNRAFSSYNIEQQGDIAKGIYRGKYPNNIDY